VFVVYYIHTGELKRHFRVKVDLTKYIEQHTFNFDDVFDTENTNNHVSNIYHDCL
jgi:hypothetical protein